MSQLCISFTEQLASLTDHGSFRKLEATNRLECKKLTNTKVTKRVADSLLSYLHQTRSISLSSKDGLFALESYFLTPCSLREVEVGKVLLLVKHFSI